MEGMSILKAEVSDFNRSCREREATGLIVIVAYPLTTFHQPLNISINNTRKSHVPKLLFSI